MARKPTVKPVARAIVSVPAGAKALPDGAAMVVAEDDEYRPSGDGTIFIPKGYCIVTFPDGSLAAMPPERFVEAYPEAE